MNQDLNDLYYYVQVVDHGGFAPAGRALGVPKSNLSRRLAVLEGRLGVRLIQRSSRRFSVTELGLAYHARCKAMLSEADAAQAIIESVRQEPRGTVRLACPIALLHAHVGSMVAAFAARFPAVQIELVGMNRTVDLVAEGLDLAIRVWPLPLRDSELAVRILGYAEECLVASPTLLARHGVPGSPIDLASWPSMGFGPPTEAHIWEFRGPNGAHASQHHNPRFITTDLNTLCHAAVAGIGVVQLPLMIVRESLSTGSLVRLLPDWSLRQDAVHVVFPTRRGLIPSVRALIDHFAEQFVNIQENLPGAAAPIVGRLRLMAHSR